MERLTEHDDAVLLNLLRRPNDHTIPAALMVASSSLPKTRVQRTRSSASPPHSLLTGSPLGGPKLLLVFVALLAIGAPRVAVAMEAPDAWFAGVDEHARFIDPACPDRVSFDMTLGEVFRILGPAHWAPCMDLICFAWIFDDETEFAVVADEWSPDARLTSVAKLFGEPVDPSDGQLAPKPSGEE
jgi:hypothetical protein